MTKFIHPVSAAACLERWRAAHKDVVERVFRKRLRQFPDHIDDGIQSFWLDFLEQEQCERYDAVLCPEAGYVGVLALRCAVNLFLKLVRQQRRDAAIEDADSRPPERVPQGTGDDPSEYLLHLVSTNCLKPAEALVFLCKVWANVGPVELAERNWNSTLFELCDFVTAYFKKPDVNLESPRKLLGVLREQLTLPPGGPLGERRLIELVQGRHDTAPTGCASTHALRDVLFDYLEAVKRVCERGERRIHESPSEFIKRVVASLLKAVRDRFRFLIKLTKDKLRPVRAENLLAWGWEKLLNMEVEKYGDLSCARGSRWLVERMAFLLPGFPAPNDLARTLAGSWPDETILHCLQLLETDSFHAVRAVEARYDRACSRNG
jgi:hypothetical protein